MECSAGKKLSNATILYAEDNEIVRKLTKTVLKNEGYKVITARDGENALRIFNKNKNKIDMFIFDVIMPKIDGDELYKVINMKKKGIPVLFCSAYKDSELDDKYLKSVNARYIQKPYDPDTLLSEVRNMTYNK